MSKTAKYILYGVGSFVCCLLIMVLIRKLAKGVSFADGIRDWSNWAVAVAGGIGFAISVWKKDQAKK